jgi:hypothetical protein
MARLEVLTPGASVRGILPDALATVVSVRWFGSEALELTYKSPMRTADRRPGACAEQLSPPSS